MKCIFCNNTETKVVDSRESEDLTRRRRECLICQKRFTTYERAEDPQVYIIKKDNRRELYNRGKLKGGILKACEKRPISLEKIDIGINKIESKLRTLENNEIQSKLLGEEVAKMLKQLDKVAYIRFASVYREFEDIGDFKKEIQILSKRRG
ncbi:transcriptional regulator NrdR [Candidatus Woesearchaeota archaeon]|nr:transcriptional regulator NrdR [Candidatus Woesearchaeota archaeon]